VGARSIACIMRNTDTVHKLRWSFCHISKAPPTPSPNWDSPSTRTPWSSFSPALPFAAIRTQWPVPQACLRGMPNFSTSHGPSRGHYAPCCPRVTNILPLAMHRAPIPLAADCSSAAARFLDRRIVSFECKAVRWLFCTVVLASFSLDLRSGMHESCMRRVVVFHKTRP
jgi:hypothetical protein